MRNNPFQAAYPENSTGVREMFEEDQVQENDEMRQIVMFELADEAYGVELGIVQEVIRSSEITKVRQTPKFIDGVINLRGYVVPVVDIKKRFSMGQVQNSRYSRIMIVEIEQQIIGIAVDKVLEVTMISLNSIEPPSPLILGTIRMNYLEGFVEVDNRLVKLLRLERVFSMDELRALRDLEVGATEEELMI